MLIVRKLKCRYGNVPAVNGINLSVKSGELVALVGANGAGKTTLLQAICGFVPDWEGEIVFGNTPLRGISPSRIVEKGISLVPEGRLLFPPLSVRENLELGAYLRLAQARGRWRFEGPGKHFRTFPYPEAKGKTAGGNSFRRRTTDAGNRAGVDGAAQASSTR